MSAGIRKGARPLSPSSSNYSEKEYFRKEALYAPYFLAVVVLGVIGTAGSFPKAIDRALSPLLANEQAAAQANSNDLVALRRDAERYRWLREREVRINGKEVWWQGAFLDLRCDTGLGHVQGEYGVEPKPASMRRRLPKPIPKLK